MTEEMNSMQNINKISLPTTLKNFTELVKYNEEVLYRNIDDHIAGRTDKHMASEVMFETGSNLTVEDVLNSLTGRVSEILEKISQTTAILKEVESISSEIRGIAESKTSTTINGKSGDVILKQGAGIVINEAIEPGGATFTINNTVTGGVVVTGNTGRQFTYTIDLAAVVTNESVTKLDLVLVEQGVKLQASANMKLISESDGLTVLQSINANELTETLNRGILRVSEIVNDVSIYIPGTVDEEV